jgi:hypothetical protein
MLDGHLIRFGLDSSRDHNPAMWEDLQESTPVVKLRTLPGAIVGFQGVSFSIGGMLQNNTRLPEDNGPSLEGCKHRTLAVGAHRFAG